MIKILDSLIERFPVLACCKDDIFNSFKLIERCYENGGKLLVCGNGGSAADADHIVGELMKGFLLPRIIEVQNEILSHLQSGLPAISLCAHSGLITAFSNDCDFEYIFAQQVYAYSLNNKNDMLLALSTSGNSVNVVKAVQTANEIGIKTTGPEGSTPWFAIGP